MVAIISRKSKTETTRRKEGVKKEIASLDSKRYKKIGKRKGKLPKVLARSITYDPWEARNFLFKASLRATKKPAEIERIAQRAIKNL